MTPDSIKKRVREYRVKIYVLESNCISFYTILLIELNRMPSLCLERAPMIMFLMS